MLEQTSKKSKAFILISVTLNRTIYFSLLIHIQEISSPYQILAVCRNIKLASCMLHPWNWRCRVTPNDPFHPIVQRRDRKNSKRQLKDWLQCYIAIDWLCCRQCKDPVPWIDTSHRHSSCETYLERQQPLEIDENPLSVIVSIDVFGLLTTCWILPHILDLHIDFFDQCLGLRLLSSLSALSFSSFQTRQTVSAPQFLSSK